MQHHFNNAQDQFGNGVVRASVLVQQNGVTSTIYSDNSGTVKANPMTTGAAGAFDFYAANGNYTLSITAANGSVTTSAVTLFDPDSLSASSGAGMSGFSHSQTYAAGTLGAKGKDTVSVKDAPYNAKGDGVTDDTAAIQAAFAAVPSGGVKIAFPAGTYLCNNLRLSKSNATIQMDGGATLKKNANGPVLSWGSGGYTRFDALGLSIDGNGANFTGPGLVIDGGTFPTLRHVDIVNTKAEPLQFVGDGAGHSARCSDLLLYAYDALLGGTGQNVAAILLPHDAAQAPNRHFSNVHAAGTLLFSDAGSQDSNFVNCTARNVAYTGTPAKLYLVSCRLASSGTPITLTGTQCMYVGSAFAGAVTLDGSTSNTTFTGNALAGAATVAAGAAGNVVSSNTIQGNLTIQAGATNTAVGVNRINGDFIDQGTATSIAGAGADGTYSPPATVDPRMLAATTTLNANQAVYMRAKGRGYISKIGVHIGTQSGNVCVGVYKNSGTGTAARPAARKATSGSVACPAAGYQEVALTGSVYVEDGDWLAVEADNATASFYRGAAAGFSSSLANGLSHFQSSAFPLPDPAVPSGTGAIFSVILVGVA